jgi:hypothetical protein
MFPRLIEYVSLFRQAVVEANGMYTKFYIDQFAIILHNSTGGIIEKVHCITKMATQALRHTPSWIQFPV